jgi:glucose uptake protein GlcU
MFFQFIMCSAIFVAGLINYIVQCSQQGACPKFEPVAMLGGAIWCLGNSAAVPIIKTIGLAKGMLVWGMVNMLMGWASGKFGFFGLLTPNKLSNPTLNYVGVLIACVALGVFLFIKPEAMGGAKRAGGGAGGLEGAEGLLDEEHDAAYVKGIVTDGEVAGAAGINAGGSGDAAAAAAGGEGEETSWTDKMTDSQKQVFGVVASAVSGLLYGANFNPPQYVVDHPDAFPGASMDLADYVFPHFCGILLTSICIVQAYAALSNNAPKVYPEIVLPGFISGLMWATAQICWFSANAKLGFAVAFPLISIGPGLVSALWGVFVFGEIKGARNYGFVAAAFSLVTAAAVCIALSNS